MFRKFLQTSEEEHLVHLAESEEESKTPLLLALAHLPLKSGKITPVSRGSHTEKLLREGSAEWTIRLNPGGQLTSELFIMILCGLKFVVSSCRKLKFTT